MSKRKITAEDASRTFPVGMKVKYFPISNEDEFTETSILSKVWALGHGELVVRVKGITGGVCISHLKSRMAGD